MIDDPTPARRGGPAMSKLALATLAALAVLVNCILALVDTDDVWLVIVTVVSIILIGIVVVVDVWRVMDRDADEPADPPSRRADAPR
jgi:hypothetical protein